MLLSRTKELCSDIWSGYKRFAESGFVLRSGYSLTGMTKVPTNLGIAEEFEWRGESVLEHQAKVAWLVKAFQANFPRYFFIDDTDRLITVGLTHDTGETVVGDIADNGNPRHGTKDAEEFKAVKSLYDESYGYESGKIATVFKQFQDKRTHDGWALYALDKIEAILMQILLESHGVKGSIKGKTYETELDKYFARITGTDSPTDIWAARMKYSLRNCNEPTIIEPIFGLIEVAITDVRGDKGYDWWDKYIPEDIPLCKE